MMVLRADGGAGPELGLRMDDGGGVNREWLTASGCFEWCDAVGF
jgi:hypothetical protein